MYNRQINALWIALLITSDVTKMQLYVLWNISEQNAMNFRFILDITWHQTKERGSVWKMNAETMESGPLKKFLRRGLIQEW